MFISFPHFLYANESYSEHLTGLHPESSKHGSWVDYEPTLGIPMSLDTKYQVNLMVERNNNIDAMNNSYVKFGKLLVPQMWVRVSSEADHSFEERVKSLIKNIE